MSAVEEQSQGVSNLVPENNIVGTISKSELDQAIMTAKANPRSVTTFKRECFALATMDVQTADECVYAVPRDGKMIEGPSIRFAEIVLHSWRNCRGGARVIEEGREFVTAQGVFMDLENNVSITREVRRRITNREGRRYSADMITTTANAACSIALRNAVFNGVPKAFWNSIFEEARVVCIGNSKTLGTRRAEILEKLLKYGVKNEVVFAHLGIKGIDDITLEKISVLIGLGNAIKESELTIEEAFPPLNPEPVKQPAGTRTNQAKEAMRTSQSKQSQSETVKPIAINDALKMINESGDAQMLKDAWIEISGSYANVTNGVPLEIEAPYKQRLEQLQQI